MQDIISFQTVKQPEQQQRIHKPLSLYCQPTTVKHYFFATS